MKITPIARSGSGIWLQPDLFAPDTLMTATSATSAPTTCAATTNAISSPAWEFGASPYVGPAGQTIGPFGPDHAPANLSPRRARALGLLTIGTCGPIGPGSSASAALSHLLGNRLKALLAGLGSTLYHLTWKVTATPAGRPFFLLRGSVLRTCGIASSGWPTPTATDAERRGQTTADPNALRLNAAARLVGWPTPKAEDAESTGFSQKRLAAGKTPDNLHSATKLLVGGWATPNHRDYRTPAHRSYEERGGGKKGENLNHQVYQQIPGATPNGLVAVTASGGLLAPAFSLWLLGIPATFLSYGPSVTLSRPTRRRPSSAPG